MVDVNKNINRVINASWTLRFKRWKKMTNEEKMNRLWFIFRLVIIFMGINAFFEIYKNYVLLQSLNML